MHSEQDLLAFADALKLCKLSQIQRLHIQIRGLRGQESVSWTNFEEWKILFSPGPGTKKESRFYFNFSELKALVIEFVGLNIAQLPPDAGIVELMMLLGKGSRFPRCSIEGFLDQRLANFFARQIGDAPATPVRWRPQPLNTYIPVTDYISPADPWKGKLVHLRYPVVFCEETGKLLQMFGAYNNSFRALQRTLHNQVRSRLQK